MGSCWRTFPEAEWDGKGFPKVLANPPKANADVKAYLKRMFEYHKGELISVADEWRPFATMPAELASGNLDQLASGGLWHPQLLSSKKDRTAVRTLLETHADSAARQWTDMDSLVFKSKNRIRQLHHSAVVAVREALVFSLPTLIWNLWNNFSLYEFYTFYMKQPLICLKRPARSTRPGRRKR